MSDEDRRNFILYCLKGNTDAARFCQDIFTISQIWDDLVDRDSPVENGKINLMMWKALIDIQRNPFFYQHSMILTQYLEVYINDWLDANNLECGTDHERNIAFVLRDKVGSLLSQCARIVGGYEWLREVSPDIRRFVYDESLESYKNNLPPNE